MFCSLAVSFPCGDTWNIFHLKVDTKGEAQCRKESLQELCSVSTFTPTHLTFWGNEVMVKPYKAAFPPVGTVVRAVWAGDTLASTLALAGTWCSRPQRSRSAQEIKLEALCGGGKAALTGQDRHGRGTAGERHHIPKEEFFAQVFTSKRILTAVGWFDLWHTHWMGSSEPHENMQH